ncbi:MAG TPA: cation:proton antiporter [Streptosporangiaceae bacterium]|jgi:Kef-type K+ transport system membrane component KefB|nr:cation:proton antiporter [Streptosporangiaceae bacterium]
MISFSSLLIVGAVAVAVPLLLGLVPAVKVPAVVLEILGGILVGPTVLGWVHLDVAVRVIADLGLGFLLFMAGFEIDLRRFDRRILILVSRAFVLSLALALLVAYGLQLGGQVRDGLLVGITLVATSLGVLVPILHDAGEVETTFGRMIMAAGSLAELAPLVLLSVFFSASSKNPAAELGLLAGFVGLTAAIVVVTQRVRVWGPMREVVQRLENTSSQLRVRLAITFALAFSAVAEHFGLATILGAFLAGVIVRRTDETPASQEEFQAKLESIGFGFLIPVFFVSTGVGLDITALFHSTRAIILVPVFLAALLVVRGLPALLYVRVVGRTRAIAAGFMQATSLTFIVVATVIGVQTGHQRTSTAAALVVAGLLSVVIYPPVALRMLKSPDRQVAAALPPEPDPS